MLWRSCGKRRLSVDGEGKRPPGHSPAQPLSGRSSTVADAPFAGFSRTDGTSLSGTRRLRKSTGLTMQRHCSQSHRTGVRDARGLLDGQWVIAFLNEEERTSANRLKHQLKFQIQSWWVLCKRVGEPAFKGSATLSSFELPAVLDFIEHFFPNGRPQPPQERLS